MNPTFDFNQRGLSVASAYAQAFVAASGGEGGAASLRCEECQRILCDYVSLNCSHDFCLQCAAIQLIKSTPPGFIGFEHIRCKVCGVSTELGSESIAAISLTIHQLIAKCEEKQMVLRQSHFDAFQQASGVQTAVFGAVPLAVSGKIPHLPLNSYQTHASNTNTNSNSNHNNVQSQSDELEDLHYQANDYQPTYSNLHQQQPFVESDHFSSKRDYISSHSESRFQAGVTSPQQQAYQQISYRSNSQQSNCSSRQQQQQQQQQYTRSDLIYGDQVLQQSEEHFGSRNMHSAAASDNPNVREKKISTLTKPSAFQSHEPSQEDLNYNMFEKSIQAIPSSHATSTQSVGAPPGVITQIQQEQLDVYRPQMQSSLDQRVFVDGNQAVEENNEQEMQNQHQQQNEFQLQQQQQQQEFYQFPYNESQQQVEEFNQQQQSEEELQQHHDQQDERDISQVKSASEGEFANQNQPTFGERNQNGLSESNPEKEEQLILQCNSHWNEEINMYCFSCRNRLLCVKCVQNGMHRDHDVRQIGKSFDYLLVQMLETSNEISYSINLLNARKSLLQHKIRTFQSKLQSEQMFMSMHQSNSTIETLEIEQQSIQEKVSALTSLRNQFHTISMHSNQQQINIPGLSSQSLSPSPRFLTSRQPSQKNVCDYSENEKVSLFQFYAECQAILEDLGVIDRYDQVGNSSNSNMNGGSNNNNNNNKNYVQSVHGAVNVGFEGFSPAKRTSTQEFYYGNAGYSHNSYNKQLRAELSNSQITNSNTAAATNATTATTPSMESPSLNFFRASTERENQSLMFKDFLSKYSQNKHCASPRAMMMVGSSSKEPFQVLTGNNRKQNPNADIPKSMLSSETKLALGIITPTLNKASLIQSKLTPYDDKKSDQSPYKFSTPFTRQSLAATTNTAKASSKSEIHQMQFDFTKGKQNQGLSKHLESIFKSIQTTPNNIKNLRQSTKQHEISSLQSQNQTKNGQGGMFLNVFNRSIGSSSHRQEKIDSDMIRGGDISYLRASAVQQSQQLQQQQLIQKPEQKYQRKVLQEFGNILTNQIPQKAAITSTTTTTSTSAIMNGDISKRYFVSRVGGQLEAMRSVCSPSKSEIKSQFSSVMSSTSHKKSIFTEQSEHSTTESVLDSLREQKTQFKMKKLFLFKD